MQEPGEVGAVRASPLHPDLGHGPERGHPSQQAGVALGRRGEPLHPEQRTPGVQRGRDVDVQMRVHSADHGAVGFYDGHRHPFFL
jgi:hypothetical protein